MERGRLPIIHPSILPSSQSSNLLPFHPSNLPIFQSSTLPSFQSSLLPFFHPSIEQMPSKAFTCRLNNLSGSDKYLLDGRHLVLVGQNGESPCESLKCSIFFAQFENSRA